jgi:hypothetical protein
MPYLKCSEIYKDYFLNMAGDEIENIDITCNAKIFPSNKLYSEATTGIKKVTEDPKLHWYVESNGKRQYWPAPYTTMTAMTAIKEGWLPDFERHGSGTRKKSDKVRQENQP